MICINCGQQVSPEDRFCQSCGAGQTGENSGVPQPRDGVCNSCGADIGPEHRFCMHCGADQDATLSDSNVSGTGNQTTPIQGTSEQLLFILSDRLIRNAPPPTRMSYVNKYPDISILAPGAAVMLNAACRDRILSQLRSTDIFDYGKICLITWSVGTTSQLDDLLIATEQYILIYERSVQADILNPNVVITLSGIREITLDKKMLSFNKIAFKTNSSETVIHVGFGPPFDEIAFFLSILGGHACQQPISEPQPTGHETINAQHLVQQTSLQPPVQTAITDAYSSKYPDIQVLSEDAVVLLDIWCRDKMLNQLKLLGSFRFGKIFLLIWNVGINELEGGCLTGTESHILYYKDRKSAELSLPSRIFPLSEFHGWTDNGTDKISLFMADLKLVFKTGAQDCFKAFTYYLSRFKADFEKRKNSFEILEKTVNAICQLTAKSEQTTQKEDAFLKESLKNIIDLHATTYPQDVILKKALTLAVKNIFDDKEISPGELKIIVTLLTENAKQPYSNLDFIREVFRIWELALINNGYIRAYSDVDIETHGEPVYGIANCKIIEHKIITERVTGHAGISIPLTKRRGPRVYLGGSKPFYSEKEVDVVYGVGKLLITNKKILFVARDKTFDLRLSYIHEIMAYSDGFRLSTSKKQRDFVYVLGDTEITEEFLTVLRRVLSGNYCTDRSELAAVYDEWSMFRYLFTKAETQKKLGKWVDMDRTSIKYDELEPVPGTPEQRAESIGEKLIEEMAGMRESESDDESGRSDISEEGNSDAEEAGETVSLETNVLRQIIADHLCGQIKKHPEIAIAEAKYKECIVDSLLPRLKQINADRDWEKELSEYRKTCFSFIDGKLQFSQDSLGYWTI